MGLTTNSNPLKPLILTQATWTWSWLVLLPAAPFFQNKTTFKIFFTIIDVHERFDESEMKSTFCCLSNSQLFMSLVVTVNKLPPDSRMPSHVHLRKGHILRVTKLGNEQYLLSFFFREKKIKHTQINYSWKCKGALNLQLMKLERTRCSQISLLKATVSD